MLSLWETQEYTIVSTSLPSSSICSTIGLRFKLFLVQNFHNAYRLLFHGNLAAKQWLGKHKPSQSSIYTAQVTLNALVAHMGQPEILFIRKEAMLSGFFDFKMLSYFASVYAVYTVIIFQQ